MGAGQGPVGPERMGLWGKGGGASSAAGFPAPSVASRARRTASRYRRIAALAAAARWTPPATTAARPAAPSAPARARPPAAPASRCRSPPRSPRGTRDPPRPRTAPPRQPRAAGRRPPRPTRARRHRRAPRPSSIIRSGLVSEALSELVDIAPTLLEAAGLAVPEPMQGRSLLPILEGRADPHVHKPALVAEFKDAIAGGGALTGTGPAALDPRAGVRYGILVLFSTDVFGRSDRIRARARGRGRLKGLKA